MTAEQVSAASAALDEAPPTLLLRTTRYPGQGDYTIAGTDTGPDARVMRRGCSIQEILTTAYGVGAQQMVLPGTLPAGPFDLLLTAPHPRPALQAELKKRFGWAAHPETRNVSVLVLKCVNRAAPGLKTSASTVANHWTSRGSFTLKGFRMSGPGDDNIAYQLGALCNRPVIDETGMTGPYDLNLNWEVSGPAGEHKEFDNFQRALREQAGLVLTPGWRPVEMLIVEKK